VGERASHFGWLRDTPKWYGGRGALEGRLNPYFRTIRAPKAGASVRDLLIVIFFIAMVLTPAVVAARSVSDLHGDK